MQEFAFLFSSPNLAGLVKDETEKNKIIEVNDLIFIQQRQERTKTRRKGWYHPRRSEKYKVNVYSWIYFTVNGGQ